MPFVWHGQNCVKIKLRKIKKIKKLQSTTNILRILRNSLVLKRWVQHKWGRSFPSIIIPNVTGFWLCVATLHVTVNCQVFYRSFTIFLLDWNCIKNPLLEAESASSKWCKFQPDVERTFRCDIVYCFQRLKGKAKLTRT